VGTAVLTTASLFIKSLVVTASGVVGLVTNFISGTLANFPYIPFARRRKGR
jgi:hypothetical protein